MSRSTSRIGAWITAALFTMNAAAVEPRARDLGVPFDGHGALNAITDVPGVEVGHSTIVSGTHGAQVVI